MQTKIISITDSPISGSEIKQAVIKIGDDEYAGLLLKKEKAKNGK